MGEDVDSKSFLDFTGLEFDDRPRVNDGSIVDQNGGRADFLTDPPSDGLDGLRIGYITLIEMKVTLIETRTVRVRMDVEDDDGEVFEE